MMFLHVALMFDIFQICDMTKLHHDVVLNTYLWFLSDLWHDQAPTWDWLASPLWLLFWFCCLPDPFMQGHKMGLSPTRNIGASFTALNRGPWLCLLKTSRLNPGLILRKVKNSEQSWKNVSQLIFKCQIFVSEHPSVLIFLNNNTNSTHMILCPNLKQFYMSLSLHQIKLDTS